MEELKKAILVKEVIGPIIVIFSSILIYIILSHFLKRMFKSRYNRMDKRKSKTLSSLLNNILKYLIFFIAIIIILEIYGVSTAGFLTSLGVVGLVFGLAIQDTIKDFLSGITIIMENQYAVGDTITIGDFKGEVITLGLKTTKLKAYTGEVKMIANRNITEIVNHSLADSLAIVNFSVSYEENLEKVEQVLLKLCEKLTKQLSFLTGPVTLLGVTDLGDYGVGYQITAPTEPMQHFEIQRQILKEIKEELEKNHISIPYPQMVIHSA